MSAMIDMVGDALWKALANTDDFSEVALQGGRIYFHGSIPKAVLARAAIAAMREPTDLVLRAACGENGYLLLAMWRGVIAEALGQG